MKIIYKDLGFFDLFSEAFIVFKKNYKVLLMVTLVMCLPLEILPYIVNLFSEVLFKVSIQSLHDSGYIDFLFFDETSKYKIILSAFYLLCIAINIFIMSMWAYCVNLRIVYLYLNKQTEPVTKTIKKVLKDLLPIVVITFIGIVFLFAGIVLFILPGLYILGLLCVIYPIILFEEEKGVCALKRSISILKGKLLNATGINIFVFSSSFIPIFLYESKFELFMNYPTFSHFLSLGIGYIITSYSGALMVLFYLKCRESSEDIS